jgi:uncharacterized protein YigE (DUF2233 family)
MFVWRLKNDILAKLLVTSFCLVALHTLPVKAQNTDGSISWTTHSSGVEIASYNSPLSTGLVHSPFVLVRYSPENFSTQATLAADYGRSTATAREIRQLSHAILSINSSFFDPQAQPLGLIVRNGDTENKLHTGGNLLTGIFTIGRDSHPRIVHRSDLRKPFNSYLLMLQSGPRLVVGGRATTVKSPNVLSRRSGIAVTKEGEILFFITKNRLPGASFQHAQTMLSHPDLNVTDALNLDGGSSSQISVTASGQNSDLISLWDTSGGDSVPVFLSVFPKN